MMAAPGSMGLRIDRVDGTAADLLAALHRACFEDDRYVDWQASAFLRLLADMRSQAWVASVDGEPLGFVAIRSIADQSEILVIGVRPEQRRRGLGRRLLERAIEASARTGSSALFLEVAAGNAPALKLYGKAGFGRVGCRTGYYRHAESSEDALILRLDLGAPAAGTEAAETRASAPGSREVTGLQVPDAAQDS